MHRHLLLTCVAGVALAARVAESAAPWTLTEVSTIPRPAEWARELSGISWLEGDRYIAVDDASQRLHVLTIPADRLTGAVAESDLVMDAGVVLEGGRDVEGCAWDATGGVAWVSDEETATIRAHTLRGGLDRDASPVPVPETQRHLRYNRGLEALSLSPDGRSLWTANEEALSCDGPVSTEREGGVVRLVRFSRESAAKDVPWRLSGEWAYRVDPYVGDDFRGHRVSGVAGLAALPDGSMLVLEREFSVKSHLFGKPNPTFRTRVYHVAPREEADVAHSAGLGEGDVPVLSKTLLYESSGLYANFEGICLGPELADGGRIVMLVSDGGRNALRQLRTLVLRHR